MFEGIRRELAASWDVTVRISPSLSRGLIPRLRNLRAVSQSDADVHHIVGDVHYLAMGLPGERTVLTIHDCAALERLRGWRREVLRQLWFVQPMKRAAVVTTISATTKEQLRRWTGDLADKVIVIPNSVRAEFLPDPKPFNAACPVVLQVGTGWNKNVSGVAQALRGIPCRLEIVGRLDASQRQELERSGVDFRELGRISDDELLAAYRRCDLLVFASFYEGFGLPILEAQATGRPVVTSNCSSMPEAAGTGALLIDPVEPGQIAEAVQRLLADQALREELVRAGHENVLRFRPDLIARRYEEVYRRVVQS